MIPAVMNVSVVGAAAAAARRLAMSLPTAVRSFHSMGPLHVGRSTVDRRSPRAAAFGKSAQSARTPGMLRPPKPVSRWRT